MGGAMAFSQTKRGETIIDSETGLPLRAKIDDKYKWNLNDLYQSDEAVEADIKALTENISKFENYRGKIGQSSKDLFEAINFIYTFQKDFSKVYFYASLAKDLDLSDGKYQNLIDRVRQLSSKISAASSFFLPELLAVPQEKIESYIASEPGLKEYAFIIKDYFREKDHSLSATEEKLLAELAPIFNVPENTYTVLNDSELPFPTIKGKDGTDIQISHGRYRSALYSLDRDYRRSVYKGTYVPYRQLKNTIANLFNGRVKTRVIEARIRKYNSALEAALSPDNIPVSVYENLVKTVDDNLQTLQRWGDMKKKYLKLDELHPYDTYVTLFPSTSKEYTYEEACKIIMNALEPLGEDYLKNVKNALDHRWIDVYETKGKRSGAYSNGCGCGVHPYILLNWNNTLDDVFTLVHEIGHNMHTFYTERSQPYQYTNYTTFAAEVASTVNEALLLEYFVKNAKNDEEKGALLEKYLLNVQSTFFRQTRFAEFEKYVHENAEKGTYFNSDELSKIFGEMYSKYWGNSMVTDDEEYLSWARIPHLYHYDFYVFQYATGFAAAQALSSRILKEGQPAVDRYLGFLKTGNSEYTIDMLAKAGVDMSSPKPILMTIDKTNKYLDELEKLLKK